MNNHSEIVSFLSSVADLIRDTFKRCKHQDVILPLTVLRRIDGVLAPTKPRCSPPTPGSKARPRQPLSAAFSRASGQAFYNTSLYNFESLLADAPHLAANLRAYIAGFSANMREVTGEIRFPQHDGQAGRAGLLFMVMERFKTVDLHPDACPITTWAPSSRGSSAASTRRSTRTPASTSPREVVRLMVLLLLALDVDILRQSPSMPPICGHRCARRSWPPYRSETNRPKSAATSTAILNPIPSCVTPRTCRWART